MPSLTEEERVAVPLTEAEIEAIIALLEDGPALDTDRKLLLTKLRSYLPYFGG